MFNKTLSSFAFLIISFALHAQTVKVVTESVNLKGEACQGSETQLDGSFEEVETQLLKFLKTIGKVKKGDEGYIIATPVINGKSYTTPVYALVRDKGKGSAWVGIKPSEWSGSTDELKKDIEKLLYDFGVTFYRDKIQLQIDESNRALQAVERQQQRLQNQGKDLTSKLEGNKKDKINLEKAIENNKLELEALNKKISQNKKDQDSVAVAGNQIKKVILMQKDKQAKVN
jgi:hypothetical protein